MCGERMKGLGEKLGSNTMAIGVAVNTIRRGLLLVNIVVRLLVNVVPGYRKFGSCHVTKGSVVHQPS